MKRLVLPLLAVTFIVTGCGHPLIPAASTRSTPPASPTPGATIGTVDVTAKPLLGVDLYGIRNYPPATARRDGVRMLAYIKNTLKADAVGIVWNFYTPTRSSNNVISTPSNTLSVRDVEILTQIAKQDGLAVYYRPLIFVQNQSVDPWQGKITATNPAKWFSSYYQALLPYLGVAQRLSVPEFVTATEMHYMNEDPGWTPFFQKITQVYHGTLSYASYEADYFPPSTHLQNLAAVGMDMYKAMPKLRPSASVAAVLAAWDRYFKQVPKSVLQRTTIQEIGIAARADAYHAPQLLGASGRLDEKVQANWFTAACMAVKQFNMRGLFYFKVDLADVPAHPATSMSTFEGKRGAQAIAACASILR